MATTFGQENPKLTQAIKRVARDSLNVFFIPHAEDEMDNDGFDHDDVLTCLRRGTAYGPEQQGNPPESRANVVHRGLHIRVAVGGLDDCNGDWDQLSSFSVITVMKVN
ncbi:hypothetical protein [Variovorax paradoxus]|uniref:hypothetical protein n=1 Tax=Variovorax paradoxus TaxID=34073 RepID=UPI0029C6BDCC|nr:hypothetical protein RZE77_03065 [Variovorax paradoxus]